MLSLFALKATFAPVLQVRKAEPDLVTGLTFRRWYFSREALFGAPRSTWMWKHLLCVLLDVLWEWAMFGWIWFLIGNSAFLYIKDSTSR